MVQRIDFETKNFFKFHEFCGSSSKTFPKLNFFPACLSKQPSACPEEYLRLKSNLEWKKFFGRCVDGFWNLEVI